MEKDDKKPVSINRQRAEELYKRKATAFSHQLTEAETQELIRELEINKMELELQNSELRHAWAMAEVASNRYTELYDHAPTGYVTLTRDGSIVEINLHGSLLLGRERSRLKNTKIRFFLFVDTIPEFNQFLENIFESKTKNTCDVTLSYDEKRSTRVHMSGVVGENGEHAIVTMVDITERMRIQEALRESEAKYRRLFEHSSFGIFQSTPDGKVISVNPAFAAMFGYDSVEDALKTIKNISTDVFVDPNRRTEIIRQMEINPDLKTFENLYRGKDGSSFIGNLNTMPVLDSEGRLVRIEGFIENITSRKKAEEALQNSLSLTKATIESIRSGILAVDRNGSVIKTNAEFVRMWRITEEVLSSGNDKMLLDFVENQLIDPEKFIGNISDIYRKPESETYDLLYFKDGRIFERISKPMYLEGVPKGRVWSFLDITTSQQAAEALKESEIKYRNLVENSPDAITIYVDGIIVFINKECLRLMAASNPEELIGKPVIRFVHPDSRPVVIDRMKKIANDEHVLPLTEERFLRFDGSEVDVEVKAIAIRLENKPAVQLIIRDITERKLAEKALLDATNALEQRVAARTLELQTLNEELELKNKELEQFTFIASHDLQEPLLTITNFTKLFIEEYPGKLDENGNIYLDFVTGAADRMKDLIKGLLEYSLLGRGSLKTIVDCNKIIDETLSSMNSMIRENNATITVLDLPSFYGDAGTLKILFYNLIDNAIKFRKKDLPAEIKISAIKNHLDWHFSVTDNGIGIDEKDTEKIFIIFKRLHNRKDYPGIGIGLAHCKKIVELHGGRIWVESDREAGSTFHFTIPC